MKPITREEMYLAAAAGYAVTPPEPVTRKEMFLAKLAGMEVETPAVFTREEGFIEAAAMALNRSVIEPLEITENGTYTAPDGVDGYSPVVVNVATASADLKYVTFMSYDGLVEYGKKAVAVGDDCADPIARGVFSTPTRESDVQYNYTFYGWASEPNGGADSNALKAVNEDKTVYANFSKAVRYYTITYYDSDGTAVLKTESLAYGATPSYVPTKDGYTFDGWTPELTTVAGDTSYVASWINAMTFAGTSWAKLAEISAAGDASKYFKIGDTKPFTYTDGDGVVRETEVRIIGFDRDVIAATNFEGIAGFTLAIVEPQWYSRVNEENKTYKDFTATYAGGYYSSDLYTKLKNSVYANVPADVKPYIKKVRKYALAYDQGITPEQRTSWEHLWIPSISEFGYNRTKIYLQSLSAEDAALEGEKYEGLDPLDYEPCAPLWTRTSCGTISGFGAAASPYYMKNPSNAANDYSYAPTSWTSSYKVLFCFCI